MRGSGVGVSEGLGTVNPHLSAHTPGPFGLAAFSLESQRAEEEGVLGDVWVQRLTVQIWGH